MIPRSGRFAAKEYIVAPYHGKPVNSSHFQSKHVLQGSRQYTTKPGRRKLDSCRAVQTCVSLPYSVVEKEKSKTLLTQAALAISCNDEDMRNVRALILGPPESPYQFGFFEVGGSHS